MIGIYKFTNKINGMSYIGQSVDIERRYKQYKRINTDDTIFHNAIREYGFEAFDFEIIELCTKNELYNLLCKHTFTYVGEIFYVSDNTIRKWCDKYNIPRNSKYYRNIA